MTNKSLKTVITVGGALIAVLLLAIAAVWFFYLRTITVYDTDQVIAGDYTIPSGETVVLKNNASLTVQGDFTIDGILRCEQGGILVRAEGDLSVHESIECLHEDAPGSADIALVATGSVLIAEDAEVHSGGAFQVVDNEARLAKTEEDFERIFAEIEEASSGLRVGPLLETASSTVPVNAAQAFLPSMIKSLASSLVEPVMAQDASRVTISGRLIIGEGETPPDEIDARLREEEAKKKPKKIILNFDFSDDSGVALRNLEIIGPHGQGGARVTGSCDVTGQDGSDAMRFQARAGNITIDNLTLTLGNGGNGGDAVTSGDCDPAIAKGGQGGNPGNFRIMASQNFQITGEFTINPGSGGNGGHATATGKKGQDGCPAEKGGSSVATGGSGGDSKQRLSSSGSIGGSGAVSIGVAVAGDGGNGTARGGDGGSGNACGCDGGAGGSATAVGGQGGDAVTGVPSNTGVGGNGGNADAVAGQAGAGGSCGINEGPGGSGGKGGDAIARDGAGGSGDVSGGQGTVISRAGGSGGNGGDGCNEGAGGPGGSGDPVGTNGQKGKNTCFVEEQKDEVQLQVISFGGSFIPTFQLRVSGPDACDGDHWHGGPAKDFNGAVVTDPNPPACGFGKVSDVPSMPKSIDRQTAIELYGSLITEHFIQPTGGTMQKTAIPPTIIQSR